MNTNKHKSKNVEAAATRLGSSQACRFATKRQDAASTSSFLRLLRFFAAILLLSFLPSIVIAGHVPGFGNSGEFVVDTRNTAAESRELSGTFVLDGRQLDGMKHTAESGRVPVNFGGEITLVFERPIRSGATLRIGFGETLFNEKDGRTIYGHLGQDFAAPTGTPVRAVADGVVALRQNDPHPGQEVGMGNTLILRHDLSGGEVLYSLYGHLSRMDVTQGRRVSRGEIIGAVGMTGYATGPHLHFELKSGPPMPAVGVGYAGVPFSGTVFEQGGIAYNDPIHFIEGRRMTVETGASARVAHTNGIGLRLRSAPGLHASILDVMPEGATISILTEDRIPADGFEWVRVSYGGTEGWTAMAYLVPFDGGEGVPEPELGAPTGLAQFHGGTTRVLAAGETLSGRDVIFEARLPDGGGHSIRLEIELLSHDLGNTRREPGVFRSGAGHARVEVIRLAPGPHGWRARAVDSTGRTSPWTAWAGDLNSHAFTVLGLGPPQARIDTDPAGSAAAGQTVTFDARRSWPQGTGLSYSWEFSDAHTESGQTIQRTFSQPGDIEVTLTVTDEFGRTDSLTQGFYVVHSDLHAAVESLMNQTLLALDQVEARMLALADEVDFFENRMGRQERSVFFGAATGLFVTSTGLGLPAITGHEVLDLFLHDFIAVRLKRIRDELIDLVLGPVPPQGDFATSFRDIVETTIQDHRDYLVDLRGQVFAETMDLNGQQLEKIVAEINAQRRGVLGIENYFSQLSSLPVTFGDLLREDEASWSFKAAQWSQRIGFASMTLATKLKGGYLASVALPNATAKLSLKYADEIRKMGREAMMLETAIAYMWEGLTVAGRIRFGVEASLEQIRTGEPLPVPAGAIQITDRIASIDRAGIFRQRVEFNDAWTEVRVSNYGDTTASFWVYTLMQDEFSTVSLPGDGLLPLSRSYKIYTVAEQRGIEVPSGQSRTVRFDYLADGDGMSPEGEQIIYGLMAEIDNNIYLVGSHIRRFDWVDFADPIVFAAGEGEQADDFERMNALSVAAADEPEKTEVFLTPLFIHSEPSGGSADYRLTIGIRNPFETIVPMDLESVFGDDWEILSVSGASVSEDGRVYKEVDMWPGEERRIEVYVRVVDLNAADSFPSVTLTVWDPLEREEVVFEREGLPIEVQLADERVELAVREALEVFETPLTVADLRQLTELDLSSEEIVSLHGLEHATQLQTIHLAGNQILFLSPLSTLRNLHEIDLELNRIQDLTPLLMATHGGAFAGDGQINLRGNPLDLSDGAATLSQLRTLRELDVRVFTADRGTFENWREESFVPRDLLEPGISGPFVDPFGDGVKNLLRHALGADPNRSAIGHLPIPGRQPFEVDGDVADYLVLGFARPNNITDIRYSLEASGDLLDWTDLAIEPVIIDNEDGTETVILRDVQPSGEATPRFLRLKVERMD